MLYNLELNDVSRLKNGGTKLFYICMDTGINTNGMDRKTLENGHTIVAKLLVKKKPNHILCKALQWNGVLCSEFLYAKFACRLNYVSRLGLAGILAAAKADASANQVSFDSL